MEQKIKVYRGNDEDIVNQGIIEESRLGWSVKQITTSPIVATDSWFIVVTILYERPDQVENVV